MSIKMNARMKKIAAKHPKTVSELVKQLKTSKEHSHPLLIEAIDALNINHDAQYILLKAMIDTKSEQFNLEINKLNNLNKALCAVIFIMGAACLGMMIR